MQNDVLRKGLVLGILLLFVTASIVSALNENPSSNSKSTVSNGLKQQSGSIIAWGYNYNGQCNVPEPNTNFNEIAAGNTYCLGLKIDGSIIVWGSRNQVPEPNSGFIAVAGGSGHCLALKEDGSIVAWGDNDFGQCDVPSPNSGFTAIAAGNEHSLGLKADGSVVAWGINYQGQCNVPSPNSGFIAIAAGWYHSLGLKADGSIVAWGYNNFGQLDIPEPNSGFTAIDTQGLHSLGLKADGSVVAWGWNTYGQSNEPTPNSGFTAIAAGYEFNMGLKEDGSIVTWGANEYRQCSVPSPNSGFTAIAAGYWHGLGLKVTPLDVYVDDDFDSSTSGWGYDHFDVIQDGINAVAEHGTVYVYGGTYYENVVINKDSISLVGEDKTTTIIDANGIGNGLYIAYHNNNQISNFTIRNGGEHGVYIFASSSDHSWLSQNNTIKNCIITANSGNGIYIHPTGYGCRIHDTKILNCEISENGDNGIYLHAEGNHCSMGYSTNITLILDSVIKNNSGDGIRMFAENHHSFISCTKVMNNIITGNNGYGINVMLTPDCWNDNHLIYHNNFIDNGQNALDALDPSVSMNKWYNATLLEGNYWSDYMGVDANEDGIGDTPYNIPGGSNQDRYPLGYFQPSNQPPVALFTYNPSFPTDLDVVQFTDESTDADGTITSWNWEFGDGSTSTLQNPTYDYTDNGTYTVTLTVTDDDGASDTISKDVIVSNVAPIADADGPYNGTTDYAIQFNGSGSYDSDGTIVLYIWNFGDGGKGMGVNLTHKYGKSGIYNVTLLVEDDDGLTDTDTTVAVINKGASPTVRLLYPVGGEVLNGTVTVRWYAYDAIDGDNLSIYLYFQDVNATFWTQFPGNPYHNNGTCKWNTTILADGTYILGIYAVDKEDNVGIYVSDDFQIKNHEQPPENLAPNKPSQPTGPINGKIGIEYLYSTSTTDPEGDQIYYLWDWGDGSNSGWIGLCDSGSVISTTHGWTVKGTYSIKVKAKDIYGKESVWSDPLPITMPYKFNSPLLQFLELLFQRFPNAFPILRQLLGY